jgi:hypothetical protein
VIAAAGRSEEVAKVPPVDQISRRPRLAGLGDVERLVAGNGVHNVWPPPGTTVLYLQFPEPWCLVYGEPDAGAAGDWWVTDLLTIVSGGGFPTDSVLARLTEQFTGPTAVAFGHLLEWPVIYEQGGGSTVRWLKCTFRGDLGGGVEHFQHSLNIGKPGADPDISAEACLALAEQIATLWRTSLVTPISGGSTSSLENFGAAVQWTEVGVVQLSKTNGTVDQAEETSWWGWPAPTGPAGSTTTLPFEVACAVTLQTDVRGPRGRGRMFLPPFNTSQMGTDGRFAIETVTESGWAVRQFLQSIIDETPYEPLVVSKTHQVLNRITSVNIGRVPDSQRRRRRSQDEARIETLAVLDYS